MYAELWNTALKRNTAIIVAMPKGNDNIPGKTPSHDVRHFILSLGRPLLMVAAVVPGVKW